MIKLKLKAVLLLLIVNQIMRGQVPNDVLVDCYDVFSPYYGTPWWGNAYDYTTLRSNSQVVKNIQFIDYSRTELKSAVSVRLSSGVHVGNLMPATWEWTSYFHAGIDPTILEIASFHPGIWSCAQYDKFEVGIKLPPAIDQQVETFLNGGTGINPYNPDELRIEANFTHMASSTNYYREGFYYREIVNNETNTGYVQSKSTYPFRVRIAPPNYGTYYYNIKLKHLGNEIGSTEGLMEVGLSNKKGFLHVGNDNYLKDDHNNPFFVMGQDFGEIFHDYNLPNTCGGPIQPGDIITYRNRINNLADNGGNFIRVPMQVENFEIEWGELGVYGSNRTGGNNFDRQYRAKELDNVFNTCEARDVYIQLLTELDQKFQHPNFIHYVCGLPNVWPASPYSSIPGVSGYLDYFTNQNVFNQYLKRLRYINARFGYSPNLGIWETCNEINNIGHGYSNSYMNSLSTRQAIHTWAINMDNTVKSFYPKHLTTISMADNQYMEPNNLENPTRLTNYDIRSPHHYGHDKNVPKVRWEKSGIQIGGLLGTERKPALWGELGITDGVEVDDCSDVEFHKALWLTSMSGCAGAGLYRYAYELDPYRVHFKPIKAFFTNFPFFTNTFSQKHDKFPEASTANNVEAFYNVNESGTRAYAWIHNRDFYWANDPQFVPVPDFCPKDWKSQTQGVAPVYMEEIKLGGFNIGQQYKVDRWSCYGEGGFETSATITANLFQKITFMHIFGNERPPFADPAVAPDFAFKIYPKDDANFKTIGNSYTNNHSGTVILPNDSSVVSNVPVQIDLHNNQTIKYHYWDFGNGVTTTETKTVVVYDKPGTYHALYSTLNSKGDTVTYKQTFFVKNPNKFKNGRVADKVNVVVYPNPGKGSYTLRTEKEDTYAVEIFNMYGALVNSTQFTGTEQQINIENLSHGVYMFYIKRKDGVGQYIKVIKQ
jgi:hypothetical protein